MGQGYGHGGLFSAGPRHHAGDLWELWDTWGRHPGSVLVVAVNATRRRFDGSPMGPGDVFGVMGRGQAREARARYPELARWWSGVVAIGAGHAGGWYCSPIDPDPPGAGLDRRVGVLVTKANWWDRSPAWAVDMGLEALAAWGYDALKAGRDRFVLPLPGAGLGGLDAGVSRALCRRHLDARYVVCTHPAAPKPIPAG